MKFLLTTCGSGRLEDANGFKLPVPTAAITMLAYIHNAGCAVERRDLAKLLWPLNPEAAGTNLRSALLRLTKVTAYASGSLLTSAGSALVLDKDAVRCDLDALTHDDPRERLRAAADVTAKQFLPMHGNGNGGLDVWVRDVRARLVGRLRAEFVDLIASPTANLARTDLKRAAVLLLENDPGDEEIRFALGIGVDSSRRHKATGIFPVEAKPSLASSVDKCQPDASVILPPRVALLPPESARDAERQGSIANALIEDLTIGLCASRCISVVGPYTAARVQASKDKAAILEQHQITYALDTKRSDDWLFVQLVFMPTDEVIWATRLPLAPAGIAGQRLEISDAIQNAILDRIAAGNAHLDVYHHRPDAYYAYLKGRQSLSVTTLPSVRRARRQFREALDHEKGFPAALAGVARTLTMEWVLTARGDSELLIQAERLATMAMSGNERCADGYKELGVSQLYLGKIDESLGALSMAEAISPHYADAIWSHADTLVHASDPKQALEKVRSAIALSPLCPDPYLWTAAGASYFMGEYRQALGYIDQMRNSNPALRLAAACWGMLGETLKARACRMRHLKSNPDFNLERWLEMIPHKEPWQTERYREGLVKAGF